MGLTPFNLLKKMSFSVASSNYIEHGNSFQGLSTVRIAFPLWKGGTFSLDGGVSHDKKFTDDNNVENSTGLAFEAKAKQNFHTFNVLDTQTTVRGYARYRYIGGTNQLRVAAGAGIKVGNNTSIYADAHYTTKFMDGKDSYGFWIGMEQDGKWVEPLQVNINTKTGDVSILSNLGLSIKPPQKDNPKTQNSENTKYLL